MDHSLLSHPAPEGRPGCFQVLVIRTEAARNICVQVSMWMLSFRLLGGNTKQDDCRPAWHLSVFWLLSQKYHQLCAFRTTEICLSQFWVEAKGARSGHQDGRRRAVCSLLQTFCWALLWWNLRGSVGSPSFFFERGRETTHARGGRRQTLY